MKALVIAPMHNTPTRRDADEFRREAALFCKAHDLDRPVFCFDNTAAIPFRRDQVEARVEAVAPKTLDAFVVFSHGWPTGIQTGHSLPTLGHLSRLLARAARGPLSVVLYACSAGADDDRSDADEREAGPGGEGGFADRFRDELGAAGCEATIWAHTVKGHTTKNPFVRVFRPGAQSGEWVVTPRSEGWAQWVVDLRGDRRFTFWREQR